MHESVSIEPTGNLVTAGVEIRLVFITFAVRNVHQLHIACRTEKMYGQKHSDKTHIRKLLTRKAKGSMVHILDMVKSRFTNKLKKTSGSGSHDSQQSNPSVPMKAPLTRKLTQDEITETELALKRLQAEKQRLEEILNTSSSRRHLSSLRSSNSSSYSNSCEDVSTNNNVRKELVKIPRYQQKIAFLLHNVFTAEVSIANSANVETKRARFIVVNGKYKQGNFCKWEILLHHAHWALSQLGAF